MSNENLIPPGTYRAVAKAIDSDDGPVKAQFGTSTKKSTDYVLVNFEIVEGEYAGRWSPWTGYFTEKTTKRTFESLRSIGWKGDDLMQLPLQPLDQMVNIVVEHDTNANTGKTYSRVAWVNNLGGGGIKLEAPMDKNRLRQFAARMKGEAKSVAEVDAPKVDRSAPVSNGDGGAPVPGDGWGTGGGQPHGSDDVPF